MAKRAFHRAFAWILPLIFLSAPSPAIAQDDAIFVAAARMLDVASGVYVERPVIRIEGGRIAAIVPGGQVPAGGRSIDLTGLTIVPGLIDLHVHLDVRPEISGYSRLAFSDRFWAAMAVSNARRMLMAGFTTVRDLASQDYNVVGVDQAIEQGWLEGPRIITAAHAIGATGGHCDNTALPPSLAKTNVGVGDGADELRKQVREQFKYGAEVIKACVTGGIYSRRTDPARTQLSMEELTAIADEAHRLGLKAAAHAHGRDGIKDAIRAGFDTIEHASMIDDEGLALAKAHGTFLVMDVYNADYSLAMGQKFGLSAENLAKVRAVSQAQRSNFSRAVAAGVRMGFGTDAGIMPHETAARQFVTMAELGMMPIAAIRSATIEAAAAIGQSGQIGELRPGAWGDMIAVAGDPLADITLLQKPRAVIKAGRLLN